MRISKKTAVTSAIPVSILVAHALASPAMATSKIETFEKRLIEAQKANGSGPSDRTSKQESKSVQEAKSRNRRDWLKFRNAATGVRG